MKRNNKTNTFRREMLRENVNFEGKRDELLLYNGSNRHISWNVCVCLCVCIEREKFECIAASFFEKQEHARNGKMLLIASTSRYVWQCGVFGQYTTTATSFRVLISILNFSSYSWLDVFKYGKLRRISTPNKVIQAFKILRNLPSTIQRSLDTFQFSLVLLLLMQQSMRENMPVT